MKNIAFVLWVLLWPFMAKVEDCLDVAVLHRTYPESVQVLAAFIDLFLWIAIGRLLYERHP